jgi:hypothetical protein
VASCLTTEHISDTSALPELLAEVEEPVRLFIGIERSVMPILK